MRLLVTFLACTVLGGCAPTSTIAPRPTGVEPTREATAVTLSAPLEASFKSWESLGPTGDEAHQARLQKLATALREALAKSGRADALFVCTHNSRRSHMAQLLARAAALRAGLNVTTYSGGTEATAFNGRAVAALRRAGFTIEGGGDGNPRYRVAMAPTAPALEAFSKRYDDPVNPREGFVVVMTCTQADQACPIVNGAATRVAIPYEDPKQADGTPEEGARYDARVAQIGRDMAWVFGDVAQ